MRTPVRVPSGAACADGAVRGRPRGQAGPQVCGPKTTGDGGGRPKPRPARDGTDRGTLGPAATELSRHTPVKRRAGSPWMPIGRPDRTRWHDRSRSCDAEDARGVAGLQSTTDGSEVTFRRLGDAAPSRHRPADADQVRSSQEAASSRSSKDPLGGTSVADWGETRTVRPRGFSSRWLGGNCAAWPSFATAYAAQL